MRPSVSSLYQAVELVQDIPPLLIGERANPNGSRKFKECLLAEDYDGCLRIGLEQEAGGAQVLDLCVAYAGRDERADLTRMTRMFAESVKAPIVIDSTSPDCVEACLKIYPGRCVINSINLEDGGKNLGRLCQLAKKYGAAVVALTIHEKGMAMRAEEKRDTARAIYDLAVGRYGLRPHDILFDPLTFTIGSGDASLRDAGIQTLEGIRQIKAALPGVLTVLGVSNISFGLRPASRRILNSVFLHKAVEAGLDAAIIDAAKILPLAQINEADREMCLDLIRDRAVEGEDEESPLMVFINHFEEHQDADDDEEKAEEKRPEEQLHEKVLRGDKDGLGDLLSILLERYAALDIVNRLLVPAMRRVGELFGKGEILLPFVLQSAEVMKKSVDFLEPHMEKIDEEGGGAKTSILLATVQGDVHDIGKNLVDIILSNNGYRVHNLGIKVPAETIIEKARELKVDIVGLSGLLVKSAIVMQENLPQFEEAGLTMPVLLGGAALTPKFVAESCAPGYGKPVVYCADAFAGLKAVREFEEGSLTSTVWEGTDRKSARGAGAEQVAVDRSQSPPAAPFLGVRYATDIDLEAVFPYINKQALFRGRWGYRRAKMSAEEYRELTEGTVEPLYADLKQRSIGEGLLRPQVAYGYFPCYSKGESVFVEHDGRTYQFDFPRQSFAPHFCIADFFRTEAEGGDVAAFFVATVGEAIGAEAKRLFESDAYRDYLLLHGFGVEATDALAEHWHQVMRLEWGIGAEEPADAVGYVTQKYQGSRYGFGYPACPDLEAHRPLFEILKPEAISVGLTENMEMTPEQTTSAIVAHHRQAKYFAV